ncbi:hypothetical protein ABNN70_00080 [Sporolactobacillus sp. Y61]|uniref:Uncharacterized protein n=1 Tax=Sporolactobacillus sp. Y61 TaxID=3160863 RepID=A0AAU8IFJ1_9BACL|nr:hypothetical protein [Sporolactobacillus sp. THM19-2]RYL92411.1 hypothetical protein EWH91_07700 [Sporolactobacillus sp. THM19-2]
MQLTLVPVPYVQTKKGLTAQSKVNILKTIEHMDEEIERLKESKLALDEAKRIVLTEQLKGMKMALELTGYTLMYR